ncbi:hypothetical protein BDV18DRAFT_138375 [Aspergillus unguis]
MSTFDGIVKEFPFITIDYFRKNSERPPPLACFLSHVHSDHLQGLESFRAPFIYCSAATRELLLRIEKYPHRMNFNNGILESRRLHYKHLARLLRPIPLNTPTEIDLTPQHSIRVTLLDANHCTGAVMFLIEGDGKAILYTGDIRAEPWWVDGLIRHPLLIPYTLGRKQIDKIYLDTTFANTSHRFRTFPTKAEGIAELLHKLEPYPENTTFYFRAWTFGYEEVWVALAAALRSRIHVDRYQVGLYKAVSTSCREGSGAFEAHSLCGFELGNRNIPGCLSEDEASRIHSCEPGVHCTAAASKTTVYITPIVSRTENGSDVPELGAGGGLGDLYQIHELELPDQSSLARLEKLCGEKIHDPQALSKAKEALTGAFRSKSKALSLDSYGMKDAHEMSLEQLVDILSRGRLGEEPLIPEHLKTSTSIQDKMGRPLPRTIRFPYSRHSSYAELCDLVAAFKPRDIHPCTVDPLDWDEGVSMQSLFGHLCSDNKFVHDQYMRGIAAAETGEPPRKRKRLDTDSSTQLTERSAVTENSSPSQYPQLSIQVAEASNNLTAPKSRSVPVATEPTKPAVVSSAVTAPGRIAETNEFPSSSTENDSLGIPSLSAGAAKARRDTIRQAWSHLHGAQNDQGSHFQLGSLPSSWPTTDENTQLSLLVPQAQPSEVENTFERSSQVTAIHRFSSPQTTDTMRQGKTTSGHLVAEKINETDPNMNQAIDTDTVMGSDTEHQLSLPNDTHSNLHSSQHTISTSAFASQCESQNQLAGQDESGLGPDRELELIDETERDGQAAAPDPEAHPPIPPLPRRDSSIRNRKAAYAAAQEDSYDAWASIGLVSGGDNHTVEEVEL